MGSARAAHHVALGRASFARTSALHRQLTPGMGVLIGFVGAARAHGAASRDVQA